VSQVLRGVASLSRVDDFDDSSRHATGEIRLPQSFLDMPRWWTEGAEWLADLPRAIRVRCEKWDLRVVGELSHGSNAVVAPVARGGEAFALRMTLPGPGVADQVSALRFWDGRGTVQLIEADADDGVMLLERLAMDQSLNCLPVHEAIVVLGQMMRRLAVPAPLDVQSTAALVRTRRGELELAWHRLHKPFDKALMTEAIDVAAGLSSTRSDLAVNG
jgi:streptomycin 6-kinase